MCAPRDKDRRLGLQHLGPPQYTGENTVPSETPCVQRTCPSTCPIKCLTAPRAPAGCHISECPGRNQPCLDGQSPAVPAGGCTTHSPWLALHPRRAPGPRSGAEPLVLGKRVPPERGLPSRRHAMHVRGEPGARAFVDDLSGPGLPTHRAALPAIYLKSALPSGRCGSHVTRIRRERPRGFQHTLSTASPSAAAWGPGGPCVCEGTFLSLNPKRNLKSFAADF